MPRFLVEWCGVWSSEITDDAAHAQQMRGRGARITELDAVVDANRVGAGGVIAPPGNGKDSS